MKRQDNMFPPKITNLIVIDSNENGFRTLQTKYSKHSYNYAQITQRKQSKEMPEIRKSIEDMKIEFNKDRIVEGRRAEMMLEMENSVSKIKPFVRGLTNRMVKWKAETQGWKPK